MKKDNKEAHLLKEAFAKKANEIEVSSSLFNQIKVGIYEKEEENKMKTKKFSFNNKKRAMVVMMGCAVLLSATVIAGTIGKSWVGHSNHNYQTFPDAATVQKDLGFVPKYTESLPNDFEFEFGGTSESELLDESNEALTTTKGLSLLYKQEATGKQINVEAEKMEEKFIEYGAENKLQETYKGFPLYYYEKTYKFVPEDYKLTEEDQRAYDAGEMEVSYGSDEVTIEQIQSVSWNEGDIKYTVMGNDLGDLASELLIDMAKTIIDIK